ncbi:8-oxo-dGTP diphosphatase [Mariniphaga anaerophila]|uniref:8-oxo-dGTP diphosphatase n=1 Tax=Mariniphaga anaerophila TaxID=1484053 RepID=A0A1M4SGF5_9BACT|nr:NUDIX hydrolase [Mariniphaga anaerophila]SHE31242.1 8-oxo-dGTP diphosphatase [Mariniphaga anaerophila]
MILKNISVDCVIFGFRNDKLNVLLWQAEPELLEKFLTTKEEYEQIKIIFEKNPALRSDNYWGLIGTHLPSEEDLDGYAKKVLQTATGLDEVYLKQFKTFGAINRVPHLRALTVAYYALINPDYHDLKLSPIAKAVKWFDINNLPDVIFDVKEIIENALKKLREEVQYHPAGFHLLPEKFTLTQLQTMYEVILDKKLDTRNFRKKIQNMGLLIDTNQKQTHVAHRAAKLYSFDVNIYRHLVEEGLNFRI